MLGRAVRSGEFEPPQLPHIAVKVLEVSRDPDASMRRIGGLLAQDPVLSTKVLHLANSAFLQGSEPATTLHRAMVRIGTDGLKQLVFMYAFQGSVFRSKEFAEDMNVTWRHSVACGIASDLIARRRGADIHLPFLGGLIHDVGRAVAINAIASMRRYNDRLKAAEPEELVAIADKIHCRLGALIAGRWSLPDELKELLGYHHDAAIYRGENRELMYTVAAGDWLCRANGLGYGQEEPLSMEAARLFAALALGREDIEILTATLLRRTESLSGAF